MVGRAMLAALDSLDREILQELEADARQSPATLASKLGKSQSAIRRRIARLEDVGVILKYTVVLDHDLVEPSLEAYVELSFSGSTNVPRFVNMAVKLPAVREASTIAGEPDAILRLRVKHVDELRDVVTHLRELGQTTSSRTLVALGRARNQS